MERETKARTRSVQYVATVVGSVPTWESVATRRKDVRTCKEVGAPLTSRIFQFTMCIDNRQCIDARKRLVRDDAKTHTERKGGLSPHEYPFSNRQFRWDYGRRTKGRECCYSRIPEFSIFEPYGHAI
jgi:hypothetical protein